MDSGYNIAVYKFKMQFSNGNLLGFLIS